MHDLRRHHTVTIALLGGAARLIHQLVKALAAHGEVTIRLADLGTLAGLTCFASRTVHVDHRLGLPAFVATLGHELTHLVRGPVAPEHAAAEEIEVRRETADLLIPAAPLLRSIPRQWTAAEIAALARSSGVDTPTARDAVNPPAIPTQRGHLHVVAVEKVA